MSEESFINYRARSLNMICDHCNTELINGVCPNCGMNKCMDDEVWIQEIKDEDND